MVGEKAKVSLGFAHEEFETGLHICQIIGDDDERLNALFSFVRSGLESGERVACFCDRAPEGLGSEAAAPGACGHFESAGAAASYFEGGRFDPDRMLRKLSAFLEAALAEGRPGARVVGEMLPEVRTAPGGERLLEYESRVSLLLRGRPLTAMCQYDSRLFDGAALMDVLKVHPLLIIRGSVVRNPFFVSPEVFLAGLE